MAGASDCLKTQLTEQAGRQMKHRGRVLALDFGKRRIGLALSDELGITAQGLPTLERRTIREDLQALAAVVREKGVGLIVLGLPLRLSGQEGRQADTVREFGERLAKATGVAVEYWDERLTTVEANRVLAEARMTRDKQRRVVDQLAAVILLESYLGRCAS
jgi:putative Holliday junction resolvase